MLKPLKTAVAAGLALLIATSSYGNVGAQAYTTQFVTSITYQNVSGAEADVSLNFYAENSGTPTSQSLGKLPANAGASFFVGNANGLSSGFKGSAVLSSSQKIIATMVQVPQGSATVKNRPLSNGFDGVSGAANIRIPTVLKNTFDTNSRFSVQNVDTEANNLVVRFINGDAAAGAIGAEVAKDEVAALPSNAAKYYDAGTLASLPASFNGSVIIEAKRAGGADGKVVATALELSIGGTGASAFEGVPSTASANTFYMPSALCQAYGSTSSYAVQNTDAAAAASVTVKYFYRPTSDLNAALVSAEETKSIAPGAKASFVGCPTMPDGSIGSAVITSTGGKIVAIGKVFGNGLSTSAPGASVGATNLALPYVRYSVSQYDAGTRQRTFIAIQNVSTTDLAAGDVTVEYINSAGNVVGTHSLGALPAGGKQSSNPTMAAGDAAILGEFGFNSDGTFGGSAVVKGKAGSQLLVVVRVQSIGVGEDYNGIPDRKSVV